MLILALDTVTEAVGAAVVDTATDVVVGSAGFLGPAAHGEQLAPLVAEALERQGWRPATSSAHRGRSGPGPFTGLRVGLVHAAVMGWALGIPVARRVHPGRPGGAGARCRGAGPFLVATDARRRRSTGPGTTPTGIRVDGPHVSAASEIADRTLPASAPARPYAADLPGHRAPLHPDAGHPRPDRRRAGASPGSAARPDALYLRRPDATVSAARKRVTQP